MDRAFWKTVTATAVGVLLALAIAFGVQQYGLQHLVGDLNKAVPAYPIKPVPARQTPPAAGAATAMAPAPEATPNGALPEAGAQANPAVEAKDAQPRSVRGDILVIRSGGTKLLTNVPEGGSGADLSPEERAERQAEARRKDAAWRKFYQRPAGCDKAEGAALVECANHYIRAKRSFETLYNAGEL